MRSFGQEYIVKRPRKNADCETQTNVPYAISSLGSAALDSNNNNNRIIQGMTGTNHGTLKLRLLVYRGGGMFSV